ncbi:MAG: urease accessory protein UreD [Candidatus Dasytiphilus stammeri]
MDSKSVDQLGMHALEFANYHDPTPYMIKDHINNYGYLKLKFANDHKKSILSEVERNVPLMVQRPFYWDESLPKMPYVLIISTSGCISQGDRLNLVIESSPETYAHISTPAATKIHAMSNNYAALLQTFDIGKNSYIEFMPNQTIPYNNSRFISNTNITIHPTATLLYSEILMSGRKYHLNDGGFKFDIYSTSTIVKNLSKKILFAENSILQPKKYPLNGIGTMSCFEVFGNVILLTPKIYHQGILASLSNYEKLDNILACGVSRLPNNCGLIIKILGRKSYQVKNQIEIFWKIVRQEILGINSTRIFAWN